MSAVVATLPAAAAAPPAFLFAQPQPDSARLFFHSFFPLMHLMHLPHLFLHRPFGLGHHGLLGLGHHRPFGHFPFRSAPLPQDGANETGTKAAPVYFQPAYTSFIAPSGQVVQASVAAQLVPVFAGGLVPLPAQYRGAPAWPTRYAPSPPPPHQNLNLISTPPHSGTLTSGAQVLLFQGPPHASPPHRAPSDCPDSASAARIELDHSLPRETSSVTPPTRAASGPDSPLPVRPPPTIQPDRIPSRPPSQDSHPEWESTPAEEAEGATRDSESDSRVLDPLDEDTTVTTTAGMETDAP